MATACAPMSMTCAASSAGRRSSCRARIRSSWRSCSPWKCRKSTTASSRSSRSPAIPGSRAKIAVISRDSSIDPVGACVGMRGTRVQAVVGELQGEKIDIIPWSQDTASFIVNALQPAEVAKVVLDEDAERIEVVVPDDQLSLAIGRRGQNVRLASQLTGWDIDILTEQEESRAPPEGIRRAFDAVHGSAQCRRDGRPGAGLGRLSPASRKWPMSSRRDRLDRRLRRGHRPRNPDRARRTISTEIEAEHDAKRKELGVADELREIAGVTTAMLVDARRGRRQDGRGFRRLCRRRPGRLEGAQGRRDQVLPGRARRLRGVARRSRADGHGGPRSRPAGSGRPRIAADEAEAGAVRGVSNRADVRQRWARGRASWRRPRRDRKRGARRHRAPCTRQSGAR